ncbi:type II secretion system protein GspL [Burkholderia sp. Ac-20353]|uniref:type II secretion system protein GspL n=1 Tax=Burkholderia sp. Ac-20353 TaxID=2703894 RepID=UPI00197B5BCA|nr:type II secretion system protein GspL [Burkholderia sp. Ac-20353]MBN3793103.1 hypothetical protein [Burkholderia sp. Ac-20353]
MSSLIVLLPPLDTFDAATWTTMPMPYARFDGHARLTHAGDARQDVWPKAAVTLLVLAARDTLLVDVALPPVTGTKLRRILPNVVEEYLLDDAQRCHVAVGPLDKDAAQRRVAVVDRERFGGLLDVFAGAGHRRLRAVPLIHCLPVRGVGVADDDALAATPQLGGQEDDEAIAAADETTETAAATATQTGTVTEAVLADDARAVDQADVLIVHRATPRAEADHDAVDREWVELVVRQGTTGYGFAAHASALDVAIAELSRYQSIRVHALAITAHGDVPHDGDAREPHADAGQPTARTSTLARTDSPTGSAFPLAAQTLPWETLARGALACPFDLCQFEFASGARTVGIAQGWRPWRFALGLAAASLVVAVATVNIQWYRLRAREDALNARMIDAMKAAFPATTAVLDPHAQMQAGLERLRGATGEMRAGDYPVLAAALSRALTPIPSDAVATLDYRDGTLDVTFRPGTTLDAGAFRRRLQAQGLSVQEDDAKWTLGSARPAPR